MPRALYWLALILSCWRPALAQEGAPIYRDFRAELLLAIEMNDVEATRQVLAEGAAPEVNEGNPSPLTTAVLLDNLSLAAVLLKAGGDPDATEDSPIMAAVRTDSVAMTRLLFEVGATLRQEEAHELLDLALRSDDAVELYRELLDHGAGVDLALRVAVENRELAAAVYALERGADVSSLGELGLLARIGVPGEGVPEVLDLAVRDDNRAAALSYFLAAAAAAGDRRLAQQVLDRGGELSLEHLERAEDHGQDDVALFFVERMGADLATLIARAEAEGRGELAAFLKTLRRQRIAAVVAPAVAALALLFVVAALAFFVRQHVRRAPGKPLEEVVRRAAGSPPPPAAAPPARAVFETLIIPPPDPPDAPSAGAPGGAEPVERPSFAPSVAPTRVIPRPAGHKKSEPG
jgi:hypothetical protein